MAGRRDPEAETDPLGLGGSQALGPRRPGPQTQQQGPEQRAGGGDHGAGRCAAEREASEGGRDSYLLSLSSARDPAGRLDRGLWMGSGEGASNARATPLPRALAEQPPGLRSKTEEPPWPERLCQNRPTHCDATGLGK